MFKIKAEKKGYLVLIGGAEDRKDDKLILRKLVELNNAKTVTVVPSASCYPSGVSEDYFYSFKSLGVENIQVFDIREPAEADSEKYLQDIEKTDLLFLTGGDQVKLFHVFRNSELLEKIKHLHFNKGLNIGGTSAGAAVASNPMIYDGNMNGLKKGSVSYSEGFGLIKDITIDTHFISRGRLGRLSQFLCTGIASYGIGLGENTAVFIKPDHTFEVVGTGMITVVDTNNLSFTNFKQIGEGDPIVIHGITTGFLQHGSVFDMKSWKVVSVNNDSYLINDTADNRAEHEIVLINPDKRYTSL
jgi:cyanophycinase